MFKHSEYLLIVVLEHLICFRHKCIFGAIVDVTGVHGFSCKLSAGQRSRHAAVNDLKKRVLSTANIPSVSEPLGVRRKAT